MNSMMMIRTFTAATAMTPKVTRALGPEAWSCQAPSHQETRVNADRASQTTISRFSILASMAHLMT
jgi:hypothetical protein